MVTIHVNRYRQAKGDLPMLIDTRSDLRTQTAPPQPTWRRRLAERRRLQRVDRIGARLARLDGTDALLQGVAARLSAGWVQDAWFVTTVEGEQHRHVGTLRADQGVASDGVCLVGAVAVEALPGSITGPAAQRAISALWTVLHGGSAGERGSAPGITAARAYDLVRWNDAPDRRGSDVLALVDASRASIARSSTALRAELASA